MEMALRGRNGERLPQRFCLPSELGNPQRTRVPTFPQRRRLRLPNRTNCQTRANRTLFQILVQNRKTNLATALANNLNRSGRSKTLLGRIVRILLSFTCVCCTSLSAAAAPRIALFRPTLDLRSQARVQAMLSGISGPPAMLDQSDDWSSYSLLVLVSPLIPAAKHGSELTFSQKLATFYLLAGMSCWSVFREP